VEFGSSTLFASTTCEVANASTTLAEVYNGFTYGEIVSSLFLFLIFMVSCAMLWAKLFRQKL
jgi:hypothetical protein